MSMVVDTFAVTDWIENIDEIWSTILGRIELDLILFYSERLILIFPDALKLHSFISIFDVNGTFIVH